MLETVKAIVAGKADVVEEAIRKAVAQAGSNGAAEVSTENAKKKPRTGITLDKDGNSEQFFIHWISQIDMFY